jgi:hypothetical protein
MANTAVSKKYQVPILRPTPLTWAYVALAAAVLLSLLSFF